MSVAARRTRPEKHPGHDSVGGMGECRGRAAARGLGLRRRRRLRRHDAVHQACPAPMLAGTFPVRARARISRAARRSPTGVRAVVLACARRQCAGQRGAYAGHRLAGGRAGAGRGRGGPAPWWRIRRWVLSSVYLMPRDSTPAVCPAAGAAPGTGRRGGRGGGRTRHPDALGRSGAGGVRGGGRAWTWWHASGVAAGTPPAAPPESASLPLLRVAAFVFRLRHRAHALAALRDTRRRRSVARHHQRHERAARQSRRRHRTPRHGRQPAAAPAARRRRSQ